jgi:Fe-S oxidoreductase
LWVGCAGAFDERNKKVVRAFAKLLQKARVDFAILGSEEQCNGDPLRRVGNEFEFQRLARENIETLKRYGIKDIVTCCPHCFNTLKNEYPQFGGQFQVWHHTQYIEQLLTRLDNPPISPFRKGGQMKTANSPFIKGGQRGIKEEIITYHDPCYLGRHNGIYDAPRNLLVGATPPPQADAPTWRFKEMERNRNKGFCCGGGGGHMWMELRLGRNINEMRTEQALATGADIIATACPFCMTMLTNGLKAKNVENVRVMDIAEIVCSRRL